MQLLVFIGKWLECLYHGGWLIRRRNYLPFCEHLGSPPVFCGVCVAVTFLFCAFVFVLCNQGCLWVCVAVTFLSCAFVFFVFVLCNQGFLWGLCCCYFSVLCFCLLCLRPVWPRFFVGSVLLLLLCLVLLSSLSSSCVTKVFCGVCVGVTFLSCAFVFFVFVLCNQGFLWGLCCCYFSVLCFCLLCLRPV